jgi:hypothetical protein
VQTPLSGASHLSFRLVPGFLIFRS